MNKTNKQIWDNIFEQQPEIDADDCVMTCDEDGNYTPATPIGFDDEQKEYDALKEIIEGAIKKKSYKSWKIGSPLVETYTEEKDKIEEYDVIYLFSKDWEEPVIPVLVKTITDNSVEVWWLGGPDKETTIKKTIKID